MLAEDTMVRKDVARFKIGAQQALNAGQLDACNLLLQEYHQNVELGRSVNWQGAMVNQVCLLAAAGTTVYMKLMEIQRVMN
jgi:hypothetical protein